MSYHCRHNWKLVRTIWPYADGFGIQCTKCRTIINMGLTEEDAKRILKDLNENKYFMPSFPYWVIAYILFLTLIGSQLDKFSTGVLALGGIIGLTAGLWVAGNIVKRKRDLND